MSKHLPTPVRKSETQRRGAATYNKGYEEGYAQALTATGRAKPPQQSYACELCACTAGDEDGCLHPAEEIFEMRMGLRLCRHHAIEVGGGDLSRPLSRRIARCNPHPDDDAIDQFALGMKMKMAVARAKGRGGWHSKQQCTAEDLSRMLHEHVRKGDPVDVANFCMMLSMRGERIAEAAPMAGPDPELPYYCDACTKPGYGDWPCSPVCERPKQAEEWAFRRGEKVRKKSGAWWEGIVVGFYSTTQSARGYAVQLENVYGPVQIYPETALERMPSSADLCPLCQQAFKAGDVLRPRRNAPGPVHAECIERNPDTDRATGQIIRDTLPTFIFEGGE